MKTKPASIHDVLSWRLLLPCITAGIVPLLLSSAGCGSAANSADREAAVAAEAATEPAAAGRQPKSPMGKVVKRVAAGGPAYTSYALLRVSFRQPSIAFPRMEPAADKEFEVYKRSQAELLKCRFVMAHALRSPAVKELNVDNRYRDPAQWLAENIVVEFPSDAEVMKVSLTSQDRDEAQILLQAVVDAYLSQVVAVERNQVRARLDRLERACTECSMRVRTRRSELRELSELLGAAEGRGASLRQQLAVEQFLDLQKEHARLQADMKRAKAELDMRKAAIKGLAEAENSELEIDALAQSDPQTSQVLLPSLVQVRRQLADLALAETASKTAPDAQYVAKLQRYAQDVEKQLAARRQELGDKLRQGKTAAIKTEIRTLEQQIAVGMDMVGQSARELQEKQKVAERLGGSTIDLDMARAEIDQLDALLRDLAQEKERLAIEIFAAERITLVQIATLPTSRD